MAHKSIESEKSNQSRTLDASCAHSRIDDPAIPQVKTVSGAPDAGQHSSMTNTTPGPKAVVSLIIGFFECSLFSLLAVGWPNLVFLYKDLGLFPGVCPNVTGVNSTGSCAEDDRYYNICFTVTETVRTVSLLLWGLLFDKYGLLITRLVSTFLFIPGCLCLAFASRDYSWLIFIGLPLIAAGGVNITVTAINVSAQAGDRSALVTSVYSGGINISVIVFFLVKELYEGANVSLNVSMSCLGGLYLMSLAHVYFLLPHYKVGVEKPTKHIAKEGSDPVEGEAVDKPSKVLDVIKSPLYVLLVAWTAVMFLKFNFAIGGMNLWLEVGTNGNNELVGEYLRAFIYASFGGLLVSPVVGIITDRSRKFGLGSKAMGTGIGRAMCFVPSLTIGTAIAFIHSVLSLFWGEELVYANLILLVIFRAILFANWYPYIGIVFPVNVMGTLLGGSFIIAGIFSLLQYGLFVWAGNSSFVPANGCLLLLVTITSAFPIYLLYSYRGTAKIGKHARPKINISTVESINMM